MRSFQVEGALAINEHRYPGRPHQDVSTFGRFDEFHLVAQAVATATADGDPQVLALALACDQRCDFLSGSWRHEYEVLISFPNSFGQRTAPRRHRHLR